MTPFEELQALAATLGLTLTQDADGRYVVDDNKGGKVWYDNLPEVQPDLEELQATEAPAAAPTAPAARFADNAREPGSYRAAR